MTKKILAGIISVVLFICFLFIVNENTKNKKVSETINLALSYDEDSTIPSPDTIFHSIFSDSFKEEIVVMKVGGKYGLYDSLNKRCLTGTDYDDINSFAAENAIGFIKDKKYGFLNEKGIEIVPAIYDFVTDFSYGLAAVKLNEKWGYVDQSARVIIPIEYEMAWTFTLGRGAVKKEGKWGFINKKGKYILDPKYDDVTYNFSEEIPVANVSVNYHHYFIDKNGKYLEDSEPYTKYKNN